MALIMQNVGNYVTADTVLTLLRISAPAGGVRGQTSVQLVKLR
ncbi:hypothetical protein [Streptomyces misionensis]|nr:hypothetical protein [Streptomyces misionensis]